MHNLTLFRPLLHKARNAIKRDRYGDIFINFCVIKLAWQ